MNYATAFYLALAALGASTLHSWQSGQDADAGRVKIAKQEADIRVQAARIIDLTQKHDDELYDTRSEQVMLMYTLQDKLEACEKGKTK